MLTSIILIDTKYHKLIYWRLQVTEFTKYIDSVAACRYKHELWTYPHGRHAQLVIIIIIISIILARVTYNQVLPFESTTWPVSYHIN